MDDEELDLRNMGVKNGEGDVWRERNGHVRGGGGEPRENLKGCIAKEEEIREGI
jgi:hypothetical protein